MASSSCMYKVQGSLVLCRFLTSKTFVNNTRMKTLTEQQTKDIWRHNDAVCFDVDSTVVTGEGIDEIARFCGRGEEVAQWTKKAMSGGMSFREALNARLNIIKPSSKQVEDFISSNPLHLTENIRELISTLTSKGSAVYLVSGGFLEIIEPLTELVGIPKDNVFANQLIFDDQGNYSGFDTNQPTSDSGGKAKVIGMLKQKYKYKSLVMVGDGATDIEACPPADAFIGFGGNVVRENVKKNASWYVTDFATLLNEFKKD